MKNFIFLFLLFFFPIILNSQLWLVDPLEAIYPDNNKVSNFAIKWKSDVAQNSYADVHILVQIPKGEKYTITSSLNGKEPGINNLHQLIDVPVEENTGLDSRTEQFINQKNPHVIRRAPFRIFEVINPITESEFVSSSNFDAFRLSIPTSGLSKGMNKVQISLTSKGINKKAYFKFKVYSSIIPDLEDASFFYTNWFNLRRMEEKHDLERWSDVWFEMLEKYAALMAHGRQNSITIPGELILYENEEFTLDNKKLLRFIDVFRKHGFQYYESPHLMNRGKEDDWGDPELKVGKTGRRYYTENGKADIEKMAILFRDFATKNGLTENWLQHIADEPTAVNASCYKDAAAQVKSIFPEAKIMEATNDRDSLVGGIDIWCPLINDFQENESFFRERESKGEEVLIYTCLVPGGKWLNRTLDMERIRQVYFGWAAAFYNTGGYLHWGLNQYYSDPFKQSVVKHPSPIASSNNYLPAGDTHIIYPGKQGPLSSLRFEAHRIGIEDYELLKTLKATNQKKVDTLIDRLFQSYTDYNLDLRQYRKTKKKLLNTIK